MTWSIVLKVILLVKQMLKENKRIKWNKKVEIKCKRLIENQKKLLRLFDDLLKTIFNESESESESESVNKNESVNEN